MVKIPSLLQCDTVLRIRVSNNTAQYPRRSKSVEKLTGDYR